MKPYKHGFELQNIRSSESRLELVREKQTRRINRRFIIAVGVAVLLIVVGVVIGVILSKRKDDSDKESGDNSEQKGSSTLKTTTNPTTISSSPVSTTRTTGPPTKPSPVLTTTDPGQDWLKEPCQSPHTVTCPWSSNPVLMISLDGFRAEYLTRNLTPTLQRLTSCGVHTPYMRAVYPTLTFPNHYTIVTGLYPESHGIVDNNMYDPVINAKFSLGGTEKMNPAWWGGEPIWTTAKKQGKRTAAYFWVGSDVNISGVMPDIYYPYNGSVPYEQRVDTVLDWLSWPDTHRPDLVTLYFDEPDHAGHGSGPVSPEVDAMLGKMDAVINRLMNGLYRRQIHNCVNLIVLADHGMESTSCDRRVFLSQYLNTSEFLIFDGTIGRLHRRFHEEKVGRNYVVKNTTNARPLEDMKDLLRCKSGHIQMFDQTEIPIRHHYMNNQRIGDLLLDMQTRWTVARNSHTYCLEGNHGFDNLYKSMQALFIAHGPDFKQGIQIEPFENIELYNLLCELLKINPAPNNGTFGSLNHMLLLPPPVPTTSRVMSPQCKNISTANTPNDTCFCVNKGKIGESVLSTGAYSSPLGKPELTVADDVCILSSNDTSSGYSKTTHMPVWTSFILYPNKTLENMTEICVVPDQRVEVLPCRSYRNQSISHHFIFNSGFSHKNLDGVHSLSSNIVPMYDGFRDGILKYTLNLILDYANQKSGIEVIIGPAFDYKRNGLWEHMSSNTKYVNDGGVPLPTHYYIIVIACTQGNITHCNSQNIELLSFVLPHIPEVPNCMPEEEYLMENVARIRDVELLTGIKFLTGLEVNNAARLRTFLPTSLWKPSSGSLKWKDLPCSASTSGTCPGKVPLLLISLDGFRADYVTRKLTPVIEKLRTCGVHTPYMRSVYPTVTFPNHYTIVTGLYPESHGIISNNMYDADIGDVFTLGSYTKSDPRWWGGEPIWNTAKRQGKKTFTYFWPGSDVNVSGSYPDMWHAYDGQIGFPERLKTVLEWLTLPDDQKPDIVTLYFDEPDHAGHQKGPESELVNGQLETVDDMLGRLMDSLYQEGLQDCVNIIVIADHGMDDVSCSNLVKLPQYMPQDIHKVLVFDGTFGRIENDYERISKYKVKTENVTVVPISKITDQLMCKNPAMKVFTKETIPKRFHYYNNKRIGDILLDIQDSWLVTDTNTFYCTGGNHGWDNLYKSMHALFLAHGPAFKQEVEIDPFENIELYNLMSDIIGIVPSPNNGTFGTLHHILRNPSQMPTVTVNQSNSSGIVSFPVCGCQSVNVLDSLSTSDTLPFGIPAVSEGDMYTKIYPKYASGYTDSRPLWTTVTLSKTKNPPSFADSCYLNNLKENLTCDSFNNGQRNISLEMLYNNVNPINGTHFLSSAVPMFSGFKTGIWDYVWQLAHDYSVQYGHITVTTGPVYDYNGDGLVDLMFDNTSTVVIPTHYYVILMKCKVFPCNDTDVQVQSFILPHVQTAPNCLYSIDYLKDNVARVRDIELLTGLQFFTQNIDQSLAARLRTYLPVNLWPTEMTKTWLDHSCPSELETCSSDYQPLVLISLDGFRADYLLRNFTPYVRKLSQCGVHAPYMRSVYPTKTFPNHYSIVTGLYPESHGIIDNNMDDPDIPAWFGMSKPNASDPRWWKGEPIWNTVKKNNKTAATYFWPGSDVQIQGMYPDIWKKYDGNIPFSTRVDTLLGWLDLPEGQRPDFVTLYFDEPDHAGHSFGPDDIVQIGQALEKVDDAVGRLMEGLYRRNLHKCVNLIIIADHGMSDTDCDKLITIRDYTNQYNNMYVYEGPFGRINPSIRYGSTHPHPVTHPVPISDIVANMSCKSPHMKIYEKFLLPKRHHYANSKRISDIIVDMEDQWLFTFRSKSSYNKRFCRGGNHGYDNIYKSMNALFLAHGPSFKQNLAVEPFENIELYNLMSVLLNITAAPNNGTEGSLYKLLRQPPGVSEPASTQYHSNRTDNPTKNSLSDDCLNRCPAFQNNMHTSFNKNTTESEHTPFGVPVLQSFHRRTVLLYQHTHITGYDIDVNNTLWVAYTLNQNSTASPDAPDCVLPDDRVVTLSVDKTSCSQAKNIHLNYTWSSLMLAEKQPPVFERLSSVYVPVYKDFNSGIWNNIKRKVSHWLTLYGVLNIVTGPAYDYDYDGLPDSKETIKRYNHTDVPIPSHIFLIITRCESGGAQITHCSKLKSTSFILPNIQHDNNCQSPDNYLTDNEARIRDIELLTGLRFFQNYNDNVSLRTFLPHGLWSNV